MKKLKLFFLGVAGMALLGLSSCTVTMPLAATSNPVGSKVGISKATGYFGPVGMGLYFNQDYSIQTAAKNGGIKKISTVDVRTTNVLNLIYTYETIVTGE